MSQSDTFLESLRISSPCQASWAEMKGDDRVRFCGSCEKQVYDMSNYTRAEAEELVRSREGVCVRMARRADGTVVTSDCPVGAEKKARRQKIAAVVGGGLLAASALLSKVRADAQPRLLSADRPVSELVGSQANGSRSPHKPGASGDWLAQVLKQLSKLREPEPIEVRMGDISEPEPRPLMGAIAPAQPPVPPRPSK